MSMPQIKYCPGTLAKGHTTYSSLCLRRVFHGKKVSLYFSIRRLGDYLYANHHFIIGHALPGDDKVVVSKPPEIRHFNEDGNQTEN